MLINHGEKGLGVIAQRNKKKICVGSCLKIYFPVILSNQCHENSWYKLGSQVQSQIGKPETSLQSSVLCRKQQRFSE